MVAADIGYPHVRTAYLFLRLFGHFLTQLHNNFLIFITKFQKYQGGRRFKIDVGVLFTLEFGVVVRPLAFRLWGSGFDPY